MTMRPAGYSGTPLAKKLGIAAGTRLLVKAAPDGYRDWLEPLPADVVFQKTLSKATDIVHLFVMQRAVLARELTLLRTRLRSDGMIWVSWPKKTAKVTTDITEDVIRAVALPLGLVDIKVCAVNDVWSGLKLMIRKELRPK